MALISILCKTGVYKESASLSCFPQPSRWAEMLMVLDMWFGEAWYPIGAKIERFSWGGHS